MRKISTSTWQASLHQLLGQQPERRVAILGIGNVLRCDDAAGVLVARGLKFHVVEHDLLVIEAGHAPENLTADLRRFRPDLILLIDAAEMGELPGAVRWIDVDELDGLSASTHTMPLCMLASYLTLELNCQVALLGIQPKSNDVGETISPEISQAVDAVVGDLMQLLSCV
jgi:hydrogenase 3 maturation protease